MTEDSDQGSEWRGSARAELKYQAAQVVLGGTDPVTSDVDCFKAGGGLFTTKMLSQSSLADIQGSNESGRRRFTLAHELGHHLLGDAYAAEAGSKEGVETLIDAFAVHFLLPRGPVCKMWRARSSDGERLAAVAIAYSFRTSWSATVNQLFTFKLIDRPKWQWLRENRPTDADGIALGERWISELDAPAFPPEYGRKVLMAYENGKLTSTRTRELLLGKLSEHALPAQHEIPIDALRSAFDPL